MAVQLVLLTHGQIGASLLTEAETILGGLPAEVALKSVDQAEVSKIIPAELCEELQGFDQGNGVLVLTDLYGATPCNCLEKEARAQPRLAIVSGLSLPMLLRALNYSQQELPALAQSAAEGAVKGVQVIGV